MDKPVVDRRYLEESDACIRAMELLLKRHVKKEATPESRPEDARERINDARTQTHCT